MARVEVLIFAGARVTTYQRKPGAKSGAPTIGFHIRILPITLLMHFSNYALSG